MLLPEVPAHELVGGRATAATVRLPAAGVALGPDESGTPLVIRLFGEKPVRVRVVSTGPLAQLLGYRAVALGAKVTVVTDAVAAWAPLVSALPRQGAVPAAMRPSAGAHVTGRPPLTVLPSGSRVPAHGSAGAPSLVVDATSGSDALPSWEHGHWQTFVSVDAADELTVAALADLRTFGLLLCERMPPFAVERVRDAYGLAYDRAVWLSQLPPGKIAVAVPGQLALVDLELSARERSLFDRPRTP